MARETIAIQLNTDRDADLLAVIAALPRGSYHQPGGKQAALKAALRAALVGTPAIPAGRTGRHELQEMRREVQRLTAELNATQREVERLTAELNAARASRARKPASRSPAQGADSPLFRQRLAALTASLDATSWE